MNYALLDSGNGEKLEQFGEHLLIRPASQAIWKPHSIEKWKGARARFTRDEKKGWLAKTPLPKQWTTRLGGLTFKIAPTDFGHVGLFPEHSELWPQFTSLIREAKRPVHILNLFAYSGGATLAAAQAGAKVCHLDASQGMVAWARENAALNDLTQAPIRWIVDDVHKFLMRELRRGVVYDGIIMDPPSFGRGSQGEVFKLEDGLTSLLELSAQLLSQNPLFVLLSSHTPGVTPLVMQHLLKQSFPKGKISGGEMMIPSSTGMHLPSGGYAMVNYVS